MTSPRLSVLMPVYNTEPEYLSQAIDSVLSQSFTEFEFLIYDDGSTREDTLALLERYAASDDRIRLMHEKNGGVAYARKRLVEEASAGLCAIMDSDDIAHPLRFEKQLDFLEKHPDVGICGSWFHRFPSDTMVCLPTLPGYLDFLRENCLGNSTVMFNKEILSRYGLNFNEKCRYCEDYELYARAARLVKIVNLPEVLLEYRERPDSLCHADLEAIHNADWYIHRRMLDFLTRREEWRGETSSLVSELPAVHRPLPQTLPLQGKKRFFSRFKRPVVVRLMGGLGNQMFQYAFGCALAERLGRRVKFDLSWFEEAVKTIVNKEKKENSDGVVMRDYALDVFSAPVPLADRSLVRRLSRRKNVETVTSYHRFDPSLMDHPRGGLWEGYFQNEGYFSSLKPYLKKAFAFPSFALDDTFNQTTLLRIRLYENSVFVHVRGGDYKNLGWALPPSYYFDAAAYMVSKLDDPHFFVFGEYDEAVDKALRSHTSSLEWVGDHNSLRNEDWKDMALMMHCRNAIAANSSFSWWAAWLGEAERGVVTAPSPFLDGTDEGICDSWVKIPRK